MVLAIYLHRASLYILPLSNSDSTSHILNFDNIGKKHSRLYKALVLPFLQPLTSKYILALSSGKKFYFGQATDIDSSSCTILVSNIMLIFGGKTRQRQVSVVYPWGIHRIQALVFPFTSGSCHFSNNTVYLCFDLHQQNLCRRR